MQAIRDALAREEHLVVTLLNQRKDGTEFWNELSISPVHDEDGTLTHLVGIQADVTHRVEAEQGRARALEAAQAARRPPRAPSAGSPCSPRPPRCWRPRCTSRRA